ncbi:hypothetical protein A4X13_0g3108 [Tilletia indica]|uniref:Uncharacterized protein n=1 Tax=Tilletia indica TaxID=43049 RepID=A0A177TR33_9BASI|nr:hypothetical protein A4X13_0g3108 [Tilletia indica]
MQSLTSAEYRGPLLTIVRHGETEANVARVLQGQTDSPLTPRGQAQVLALGRRWQVTNETASTSQISTSRTCVNGLPVPHAIVSSPTGRARTTASSIFLGVQSQPSPKGTQDSAFSASGELIQAQQIPTESLTSTSNRTVSSPGLLSAPTTLVLDPLLMEKDFGNLEGTRRRIRVPGFATPSPTMRGESSDGFARRIRDVGLQWLTAVGMGDAVNRYGTPIKGKGKKAAEGTSTRGVQSSDPRRMKRVMEEAERLAEQMQGDKALDDCEREIDTRSAKRPRTKKSAEDSAQTSTSESISTPATTSTSIEGPSSSENTASPHLVIVTHGLFISAFLSYFQPAIDRSSSSSTSYPFASNTGSFTLGIRPIKRLTKTSTGSMGLSQPSPAGDEVSAAPVHELFLLRANDTAHLVETGGISRPPKEEKGLQNIASFFAKKS